MSARQQLYPLARPERRNHVFTSFTTAEALQPLGTAGEGDYLKLSTPPTKEIQTTNMSATLKYPGAGPLAKGQLWKVDDAYLQIVELGKRLIHYKLMRKPDQKAVMTRMIGIESLAVYLRSNEAVLVA